MARFFHFLKKSAGKKTTAKKFMLLKSFDQFQIIGEVVFAYGSRYGNDKIYIQFNLSFIKWCVHDLSFVRESGRNDFVNKEKKAMSTLRHSQIDSKRNRLSL